jgi:hypothetical protein
MKQHLDLIAELNDCYKQRVELDARIAAAMASVLKGLAEAYGNTSESDDEWLTVKEVAKAMKCSTDYVYEHKETWPFAYKACGRWKFSKNGLRRWMDVR